MARQEGLGGAEGGSEGFFATPFGPAAAPEADLPLPEGGKPVAGVTLRQTLPDNSLIHEHKLYANYDTAPMIAAAYCFVCLLAKPTYR
jgi:hypothetical protein